MEEFTVKDKKSFFIKKYLKEHIFEFILEIITNIIFINLVLFLCENDKYLIGTIMAFFYSILKIAFEIKSYIKDYLNIKK